MTYGQLLERLQKLTPKQLRHEAYVRIDINVYRVDELEDNGEEDDGSELTLVGVVL